MITEAGSGHPGGSLSCTDILTRCTSAASWTTTRPTAQVRPATGSSWPRGMRRRRSTRRWPTPASSDRRAAHLRKLGTRLQGHPDSKPAARRGGVHRLRSARGFPWRGPCGRPAPDRRWTASSSRCSVTASARRARCGRRPCSPPIRSSGASWPSSTNNELQIDGCIHDVCDPGDLGEKFAVTSAGTCSASAATTSPRSSSFSAASRPRRADTARPVCVIARTVKGKGRLLHGEPGRLARQGAEARGT